MTKLTEHSQWGDYGDYYIFKCWCGENSYLEVSVDKKDGELYICITRHPTRFRERLKMAWEAIRGIEFTSSNSVMIVPEDVPKLIEALQQIKSLEKSREDN